MSGNQTKSNKKGCYPGATVLPPYPLRTSPNTFPLPETDEMLLKYYVYIRNYLDRLWDSYLIYCKIVNTPEASKIFKIIFSEMDYFETINTRIIERMSHTYRVQVNHDYLL